MSLNKVLLIGNVGRDPEVRYLEGGAGSQPVKVATIRLATSDRFYDRSLQETRELTEWHSVVAWRGVADQVERAVRKGYLVLVEGKLRTRSWTDRSGVKRYATEVQADLVQVLDNKGGGEASAQGDDNPYSAYIQGQQGPAAPPAQGAGDDLPF